VYGTVQLEEQIDGLALAFVKGPHVLAWPSMRAWGW
jgi:hypothetical protein